MGIVAQDDSDCTELTLHDTGLVATFDSTVCRDDACSDSYFIYGYDADFTSQEVITEFEGFPNGMRVAREFTWEAPSGKTQQSSRASPSGYTVLTCICSNCDDT